MQVSILLSILTWTSLPLVKQRWTNQTLLAYLKSDEGHGNENKGKNRPARTPHVTFVIASHSYNSLSRAVTTWDYGSTDRCGFVCFRERIEYWYSRRIESLWKSFLSHVINVFAQIHLVNYPTACVFFSYRCSERFIRSSLSSCTLASSISLSCSRWLMLYLCLLFWGLKSPAPYHKENSTQVWASIEQCIYWDTKQTTRGGEGWEKQLNDRTEKAKRECTI